jgi:tripartite-type tricarboxylate transporter receptor subunit TctC
MNTVRRIVAALSILVAAGQALAQAAYPEQSVRVLVGFTPGVAPDVTARLLAEGLSGALGKPVVVENVTGAGGNIAADRVAKASPNGYTLGMVGNGSLIFSPSLYEKLSFDPVKDFAPISQIFVAANVLWCPAPCRPGPCPNSSRWPARSQGR